VGDPEHPESVILFAPQGHGKTSHRIEVDRRINERRTDFALPVTLTEFEAVLIELETNPHTNPYLRLLRYKTLTTFDEFVSYPPERERTLQSNQTALKSFQAMLAMFAKENALSRGINPDNPTIAPLIQALNEMPQSIQTWLKRLLQLVQAVGGKSVYVLIDGIDELAATRGEPATTLRLLQPLLDAPNVLQEYGFAFKFFLPDFIEPLLLQHGVGRLDRIPIYRLRWTDDKLRDMLSQRLISHSLISPTSNVGYVNALSDLCENGEDIDARLIAAAQTSPRRLIDLARQLFELHCSITDDAHQPITESTIAQVLVAAEPASAPIAAAVVAPPREAAPPAPPPAAGVPLLFFDVPTGRLWVGTEQRTAKPLSKQLRVCMTYLWENRQKTVLYEELQRALYGDDLENRQDPSSSTTKIVRRLRELLEPGQPGSDTYIRVHPGTGYELRNFREQY
jgi:hypothetical protein